MHLRRALLLFALVLGLTAAAASLAPPPAEEAGTPDRPTPSPSTASDSGEQRISFRFPAGDGRLPTRRVEPDRPLVVVVSAKEPGDAAIPLLGRSASVTPEDPARFDLLLSDPGSYDLQFTPYDGGEARRLGKIVTRPPR